MKRPASSDDETTGKGTGAPGDTDGRQVAAQANQGASQGEREGASPADDPPEDHWPEGVDPESDLGAIRAELATLNDRHLRLAAEFNNYRRRVEQERLDLWPKAQADAVARFVDVLDDLQRIAALDLGNATVEAIMEGIDLVERKFARKLEELGVAVLDPKGEPFDPQKMEAVLSVPAPLDEDDDRVAQVFQKGYALKGQLLRAAQVSVYKRA